jgi:FkbM family methyltransferase
LSVAAKVKELVPEGMRAVARNAILSWFSKTPHAVHLGSFSQAGEDAILRFLFKDYGLPLSEVTYVDIGARHPAYGSNTYLFYCAGARGVCVDADDEFVPLFRQLRPDDDVLNVAITDGENSSGTLYHFEGGGSTLDPDEAKHRAELTGKAPKESQIAFVNFDSLIKTTIGKCPMFLSIDIEGMDLPVLKSIDFDRYPIPAICVETCTFSMTHIRPKDTTISDYLLTQGYEIYADTYVNTIMVRSNWFSRT